MCDQESAANSFKEDQQLQKPPQDWLYVMAIKCTK